MRYETTEEYLNSIGKIIEDGGTYADLKCDHTELVPMRFETSNGVMRVALVCPVCGKRKTNGIKKADYPNFDNLPIWDYQWVIDEVSARYWIAQKSHIKRKPQSDFWEAYQAYLETSKWRAKSRKVLQRDPVCTACNERKSTQAHHLTYKHVFNEPLFDLVGVCEKCHKAITRMDRYRNSKANSEIAKLYKDGTLEI